MALYLGLDSSTQSLTAVVLSVEAASGEPAWATEVIGTISLRFDDILPAYGTHNGVLPDSNPQVVHSSPLMWAETLDLLMARLREDGFDLSQVRAIAGSGQQHGSVYLNDSAALTLAGLVPDRPLAEQIRGIFSRETSPVWMDSSTHAECVEITNTLGGENVLVELTGSAAFERFTGPQIRKFFRREVEAYESTDRIHLVSSFMATLLGGAHAPIDPGDGAGMNLMDIRRKRWSSRALDATAPGLEARLPSIAQSSAVVGPISAYFAGRHGVAEDAKVVVWSGDNPCSLIGVGLVRSGQMAISLGTSDTLFGFMSELRVDPAAEGHVFGSPTGHYMSLICYKNGSLARERVRDHFDLDWRGFNEALEAAPSGNRGRVLLPWFDPEITPAVLEPGPRLYGLDWEDRSALTRAVVEGQMASMALHCRWMDVRTETIYATGGASANRSLLQVMADMFGAVVYPSRIGQTAALGAALRAWHADLASSARPADWGEIVAGVTDPVRTDRVDPDPDRVRLYRRFQELYRSCENHALREGPSPEAAREQFVSSD